MQPANLLFLLFIRDKTGITYICVKMSCDRDLRENKTDVRDQTQETNLFGTFLSLVSNTSLGLILCLVRLYLVYWVVFLKQVIASTFDK